MNPFHVLGRDLRQARRVFRREPAFVAGIVLTFALAIGANASMFGLVERLMFAPPPGIRDAERVVRLQLSYAAEDGNTFALSTTSYPTFRSIAALGDAFSAVTAVRSDSLTAGHGADLSEVAVVEATGEYFAVLGVKPALGRVFGPSDDAPPSGNDVAVLSYAYWQRRFAGDHAVVGSQLIVNDQQLTVIGVAPRGFNGTELAPADLFVPLTTASRTREPGWWSNPGMRMVAIVARLRDGVTAAAAGETAASRLRNDPTGSGRQRLAGVPLESLVPGKLARQSPQGRIALWLSGVSLVVLLIATANVGTLLQLRSAKRRRDAAVRLALGASQAHLVRQALVESVMLAVAGAALGLVLSRWFGDVVRATLLPNLAPTDRVVDHKVLLASITVACGAGLLAGLSPLTQLRRGNLAADLQTGGGHGSSGRFVVQHLLVGVQVALCMVLLFGAGLFVRSLGRVQAQDLGFSTARLLYVTLDFHGLLTGMELDLAHEEAVHRLETVPGIVSATVVQGMPFSSHHIPPINIPGYDLPPPDVQQLPIMYGATSKYLAMMGVRLRDGRLFTDRDRHGSPLVVLVNETMARTAWPGQSAIGKCIRAGVASFDGDPMAAAATLPCREVVGVVRDSRARSLRTEGNEDKLMQYYVPFAQLPSTPVPNPSSVHAILVQTEGTPDRLVAPVQRIIQGTSTVPAYARARPYQELIDPQLRSWRLGATLFSAFGALALGIAAVGLFAVVSYLAAQRTQEIGVRLALGGTGGTVARLVVGDAVRMAGAGALVGTLVAMAAAPLVQSMLFQISAREPVSALGAAALLLVVTIGAAALPSWRASRVSPMTVLRTDT
jgi:predicted permease